MAKLQKYIIHISIVMLVFGLIFMEGILEIKDMAAGQPEDLRCLLCAISGIPLVENFLDESFLTMKWLLGFSVLVVLTGRECYVLLKDLKYIAMIRYGSYKKFYRMLLYQTVCHGFLYGFAGTGITYLLYIWQGNQQISHVTFFRIGMLYIVHLIFFCLLQTIFMILTGEYIAGMMLLAGWVIMAMSSHLYFPDFWRYIPSNWGMYVRTAAITEHGITNSNVYMQMGICLLLCWLVPDRLRKEQQ